MNKFLSKVLIAICLSTFAIQTSAQADTITVSKKDSETYADTVRQVRVDIDRGGENKYVNIVRKKKIRTRISLVEIAINGFTNTAKYKLDNGINPFDLDVIKSTNIIYYPYMQRISLINRNLNLMHGLGIEYQEFNFQNPVNLVPRASEVMFDYNEDANYKKNKLKVMYVSIPVMLNMETNPFKYSRSFRLSAGVQAGIRLRSWTKNKSKELGKVKEKDDFNLHRFKVALRGEIGVGIINLFGTLNLTEFFDPNQNGGFEVYPLTIGIKVLPF